jgi:hypothetical protein
LPRFRVWLVALLAGCAQPAPVQEKPAAPEKPGELPALPATFVNSPGCAGCLGVTVTLRPDGSYVVRERVGASEFYDFGRWRRVDGILELEGGRDAPRRYALRGEGLDSQPGTQGGDLTRAPKVETLRGPFRMIGHYDGTLFKECRTGISWGFAPTRAAETLKGEFGRRQQPRALVAVDAQFEGTPEVLRVLRPATLLKGNACP